MQGEFEEFFKDQKFGPRNGFEPREFQVSALFDFIAFSNQPKVMESGRRVGWIFNGGTGAGKTKLSALVASHSLNVGGAKQVVVVVPNKTILRKTKADFLKFFGIDLAVFNKRKHSDGVPRLQQGYILTYAALLSDPTLHRRLCSFTDTLVIFDEIHHLGDDPGSMWGARAIEAFGEAAHIVGLTGTPYRCDNSFIPFVEYFPTERSGLMRFKANKTYALGEAVADGYCRKPKFIFHYGEVKIRSGEDWKKISFHDSVSEDMARERLRGAVVFGSSTRKDMLRRALEQCRLEKRKVIIFLGGDTDGDTTPTNDATNYLPAELVELGLGSGDYEVVTGDDPTAQKRIDEFPKHPTKWILVSIQMVSEGTDIPPLSAAIFLTSITAKQTTIQRIGRVLRMMENDPHKDALIFMFADSNLKQLAREIEDEVQHEINLKKRREREGNGEGGANKPKQKTEAIGVGDAPVDSVITSLKSGKVVEFEGAEITEVMSRLKDAGQSCSYENAVSYLLGRKGEL